ncbi:MAG: glycoside hydrolase family 65 protein, partial [Enterococcus sp.]|nr:glycoside hydrolase family 65 protein [Enterococcus sp.]
MKSIQRLFEIDPWKIKTHQLDKENRRLQESLTSIGNGYMGMRGNFEESYSGDHHLGTYLAGVWFPDKTRVGWWKNGYPEYFGKVINAVNFTAMSIFVNEQEIDLAKMDVQDFYLELDMEKGLLTRKFTVTIGETSVAFTFERFLSVVKKELAMIQMKAKVLAGQAKIEVISKLDNNIQNEDSNYDEMFWQAIATHEADGKSFLTTQTVANDFGIEQFTITASMAHNLPSDKTTSEPLCMSQHFTFDLKTNEQVTLEKQVLIVTSRDTKAAQQVPFAQQLFNDFGADYAQLKAEHVRAWQKRWELADVLIEGDDAAQQGIRFNLFQLFATYYGEDERLNIGPKGFTGEKYGGATYWDTEAYA